MLIEDQITQAGLVQPCNTNNIKNSTCDLTVGEIFPMGDEEQLQKSGSINEFWVEPSCIVAVRTKEKLVLPDSVTGLATLVTSLTHDGLLCLNVGVVDPGYDGHLSAFLVNFSRRPRKISLDDRLLRVIFFEHDSVSNLAAWEHRKKDYQQFLKNKAENEFSRTFLDFQGIVELAQKSAWKIVLESFVGKWTPTISLVVAVISLIIAWLSFNK